MSLASLGRFEEVTKSEFTPAFFDSASQAWRANKLQVGEGAFKYKRFVTIKKGIVKEGNKVIRRSERIAFRVKSE